MNLRTMSTSQILFDSEGGTVEPESPFTFWNKLLRYLWGWVWLLFFRPSPKLAFAWRRCLLRLFGAQIGPGALTYPSVKIWAPWNLSMAANSCMGEHVDCYSAAPVSLGVWSVVSQYSILCTASHDYEQDGMPGFQKPITIGNYAWVAADVYLGPGVAVGDGAVVGARSSVYKKVPEWEVVGGNPAKRIGSRTWRPKQ